MLFRHLFQNLIEPFVAVVDAALHSSADHTVPVRDRLIDGLSRESRPAAGKFFESQRFKRYMTGAAVELERLKHPIEGYFVKCAVKAIRIAVFILVSESPPAAADRLELLECHFVSVRSHPFHVKIRIGVRFEHQFARRAEFADDEKLLGKSDEWKRYLEETKEKYKRGPALQSQLARV